MRETLNDALIKKESQAELARALGVSPVTVWRWWHRIHRPSAKYRRMLEAIANGEAK